MLWLRTKTGDRPSLSQMDTTRKTSLRWSESCCCHLVGGWALPLWKIMEWVRQLGWWHSIPNIWTVIKKCSSHHQPEYHIYIISVTSWWAPMCLNMGCPKSWFAYLKNHHFPNQDCHCFAMFTSGLSSCHVYHVYHVFVILIKNGIPRSWLVTIPIYLIV